MNARSYRKEFYRGNRKNLIVAVAGGILLALASLALSWLLQVIVDCAAGEMENISLGMLVLIASGIMGIVLISCIVYAVYSSRFKAKALENYKNYAFSIITQKSIAAFAREESATYTSAMSNDLSPIDEYLGKVVDVPYQFVALVGTVALMLYYSPFLMLISFLFALVPVVVSMITGNRMEPRERKVSDENEGFMAVLVDALAGFSVMKSFVAETEIYRLFAEKNHKCERAKEDRNRLKLMITYISDVSGGFLQISVMLFGVWLVVTRGGTTPGVLIVFVQLLNHVLSAIFFFPEFYAKKKATQGVVEKLAKAAESNIKEEGFSVDSNLDDKICLKDVSYSYDGHEDVLKHISVDFERGKSYAIVGGSGSGKSTLLNLLMSSYDDYCGSVQVDGEELSGIRPASLYDMISVIQQNVFIFNDSIRNNITMYKEFDDAAVATAMERAGLAGILAERGSEYQCGENGTGLSGGERQRISIARALLRKASVLLVDEATAALDKENAANISNAILDLNDMTRIVITHAMEKSILSRFDEIIVMKNGRIVEQGDFDTLMGNREYFYSLYTVAN